MITHIWCRVRAGIDRVALVRQVYGVMASGDAWLDSAVFLSQSRYYEPSWGEYRYRPAEARRLLEQVDRAPRVVHHLRVIDPR